jgi:hypothetical protein
MFPRFLIYCALIVLNCSLCGCQQDKPNAPDDVPNEMLIYSLDPMPVCATSMATCFWRKGMGGNAQFRTSCFIGLGVLGKAEVKDVAVRRELMHAMRNGMAKNDGQYANCFNPRHGLRCVRKTGSLIT